MSLMTKYENNTTKYLHELIQLIRLGKSIWFEWVKGTLQGQYSYTSYIMNHVESIMAYTMLFMTLKDCVVVWLQCSSIKTRKKIELCVCVWGGGGWHVKLFTMTVTRFTGPRSAVGNVSGNRCGADCRSRGREFDPSPVPYFRGD